MEFNYKEIANAAVTYAKHSDLNLDFSEKSIDDVEIILGAYYDHLSEYDGEEGKATLWNIAIHFGIYLGETMLNNQLKDKGFWWDVDDGIPILKNDANTQLSPITKAHKRILNGPEDNLKSFCKIAISFANGNFPSKGVHRAIDIELPSGQIIENVLLKDIEYYIRLIANGKENFLILTSHDGFLQFYGIDNQFVMEIRVNLLNNDFRTYSVINKNKEHILETIQLNTPYGEFTPSEQDVISLELVKTVIRKYYENVDESDLIKGIPYIETTEEIKKLWGL